MTINEYKTVKDLIKVDDELLDNISILIEEEASHNLRILLTDLHSADIAEIINHLNVNDARFVFNLLNTETAGEVVVELDENLREKILKKIDPEKISDIVDELETDDATEIVRELPEEIAEHVLDNIDEEDSQDVKELLKYPEDSAGGIMNSDYVFVTENESVKAAIKQVRLHSEEFDHIYHIYVTKESGELIGTVLLKSLLINPLSTTISSVMEEDLIYVTPDTDQEEVANIMQKYDLVAIPVVDNNKIMLGRITIDDVVDVIQEEADEDIQKFAGLAEEEEVSDSVFRISRNRLPWLLIGLCMELVNVFMLKGFEDVIAHFAIATFFYPVVMAMGGSSGTQASIVMVRGMGTSDLWVRDTLRKLSKEFIVSIFNGIVIGTVLYLLTTQFFDNHQFILVLSLSLLVIIINATMIGAIIPVVLKKINIDPAVATGPFVTSLNDIMGLLIYMVFINLFILS